MLAAWGKEMLNMWWVYLGLTACITLITQDLTSRSMVDLGLAALVSLWVCVALGGTVTLFYALVDPWPWSTALRRPARLAVHAAVIVAGVLVGTELAVLGVAAVVPGWDVDESRQGLRAVGLLLSTIIASVSVGFERLRERADSQALLAEQAKRRAVEAELVALQARTHPHFLFNALNTVADLVETDAAAAVSAIERLATLLRHSLEGARRSRVALTEELAIASAYLEFERLRYGERLVTTIDAAGDVTSLAVLPGLVLPLVENAVNHGVAGSVGSSAVDVRVRRRGDHVEVEVVNTGDGSSSRSGTGIGHVDTRERLRLVYGERAHFEAGPDGAGGYRVVLQWPAEQVGHAIDQGESEARA